MLVRDIARGDENLGHGALPALLRRHVDVAHLARKERLLSGCLQVNRDAAQRADQHPHAGGGFDQALRFVHWVLQRNAATPR